MLRNIQRRYLLGPRLELPWSVNNEQHQGPVNYPEHFLGQNELEQHYLWKTHCTEKGIKKVPTKITGAASKYSAGQQFENMLNLDQSKDAQEHQEQLTNQLKQVKVRAYIVQYKKQCTLCGNSECKDIAHTGEHKKRALEQIDNEFRARNQGPPAAAQLDESIRLQKLYVLQEEHTARKVLQAQTKCSRCEHKPCMLLDEHADAHLDQAQAHSQPLLERWAVADAELQRLIFLRHAQAHCKACKGNPCLHKDGHYKRHAKQVKTQLALALNPKAKHLAMQDPQPMHEVHLLDQAARHCPECDYKSCIKPEAHIQAHLDLAAQAVQVHLYNSSQVRPQGETGEEGSPSGDAHMEIVEGEAEDAPTLTETARHIFIQLDAAAKPQSTYGPSLNPEGGAALKRGFHPYGAIAPPPSATNRRKALRGNTGTSESGQTVDEVEEDPGANSSKTDNPGSTTPTI